jgi:streptogramin lyase
MFSFPAWLSRRISCRSPYLAALIALTLIFFTILSGQIRAATITEWDVPGGLPSVPYELVVDDLGYLWLTEYGSGELARFNRIGGGFIEFVLPVNSYPWGIAYDKDGGWIYFSDAVNKKISRIRSSGGVSTIEEFPLETIYATGLRGLAVQNSTRIWFASFGERKIGLLNLTKPKDLRVVAWTLPDPGSQPWSVTYSKDTGLWFTDYGKNFIGNIPDETQGVIKFFKLSDGSAPVDVEVDSFGYVWFTESGRDRIGKINPRLNELTEYVLPFPGSQPYGLTIDYSNRVWIALRGANAIAVFNPDVQTFTIYRRSGSGAPSHLTTDVQNKPPIYFTDPVNDKVGKLDPYIGLTTVIARGLSSAVTTSSTGASTTTLKTGETTGFYSQIQNSTQTQASQTETVQTSTSYTVMETITIVQTSSAQVSTYLVTVTETTTSSTYTSVLGTYTSYIATATGTITSYITTYKITTAYPTSPTTSETGVLIVPGYQASSILLGLMAGSTVLLCWRALKDLLKRGKVR